MPLLTPHVPSGLIELMKNLTKEVLRDKPQNIYEFAAVHFEKLIQQRDGSLDKDYEQFVAFEAHFDGQQRFAIPPNCERFTCQRPIKIQPISAAKKSKSDMMAGFKAMESINEEDILAENPYTEEKYQKAIYTIQRYYRRYAARKKKSLSSTLTASTAAIIIQRTMRRLFANKIKLKTVGGATTKYDGVLQDDVDNVSEAASYTSSSTIQMLADSQEGRENRLPGREEVLDGDGDVDDSPTEFKEQMTAAKGEPPLVAEEDSAVAATEMDRKSIADENGNNSEDMQLAETTHEHPAPALDDTSTAHIGILSTIIGSNDQQNSLRTNTVEIDSNSSDPTPQKKTIPDVEGAGSFPLNVSQSLGATPESFPAATSPRHRPETQETFAVRLQGNGYVENNTAYPYPSGMVQVRKFDPDTGESLKIYDVFYQDKDDPDFSDSLNESTMERDSLENEDLDVDSLESNSENVTHLSGLMKREIGQDDGSLYGDSDEVQQEENVQRMVGLERAPTYLYGIYPERTPMVVRKNISTSSSAGSKKMRHKKELDATLGLGMEDRTSEEESLESKESTSEESSVTQIENVLDRNEEHDGDYLNDIDELNGEHAPSGWEPIQMKATHDFESKPFTVQELEQSAADSLDNKLKTGLDSDARESKHTRQVNEFSDSNVSDQKQTQIPSESYEEEMDSKESSKISSVKPNGIDSKSKPLHKVDVKLKTPSGNSNSTDITSTRDNVSTVNTSAGQTKNDITSETDAEKPDKKQALQNQDKGKYSIDSTKRTQHFVQKQDELSTKTKPAVNGESQKANTFDEIEASHDQRQKRSLNFNVVPQFSGNKGDDNASKEGALKSRSSSLSHQEISTDEKSKETRKATEPQLGVASSDKDAEKESEKEKTNTEHTDNADSLKIVAPAPRSNSPSYFEALYNGQNVNNYPPPSLPLDHGEEMELQLRELQSLNDMYPGLEIRDIIAEFHSKEVQPEEKRHVAHDANNNVKDFEMQSSLEDRASDHYVKHGDEGSLIAVELGKDVPKELSKYTADGSMKKHESNDIVLESEDKTAEASVKKLVKAIAEPLTSETDIGVLKIRSQIPQPKADEFKNNTEDLKVVVHPFGPVALDIAKDEASENSIVTETDDFKHNSEDNFMSTVPDVSSISSEPPRGEKLKKPISKLQETKDSKMLKTAEDKTKTNVNDAPELLNRSDRVLTPSEEINAEAVTSSSEFSGLRNDNINRDGERDFERSRTPTKATSLNAIEESSMIDALKGYKNSVQDYISNEKKNFVEKLTDLFDTEDDQDKDKSISERQAEKSDRVEDLKEKSISAVKTTELTIKPIAPKQSSVSGVANMANDSTSGVTELTIKPIAPKQSSVYGVANMANDSTSGVIVQETKSNLIRDKPDSKNGDEKAKLTTDRIKTQQLVETAIRNTGDLEAELKRQPIMNEFGNGPLIKDADTPRIAVSENEQDLGININTKFLEAEHLNVYTLPQASLESKSVTVPIDITTNDDSIAGTSSSRKPTEPTSTNASEEASIMDTLKSYKNTVQEYIANEKKDFVEKLTDLFDKEDDQDKGKSVSQTQTEKSDSLKDLKEKSISAVKTTELNSKPKTPTELTNPNAIEESSMIDALKGYKSTAQDYISNEKMDFVEKLTDLFDKEDDQDKGKSISQTQAGKSDSLKDLKEKSISAVKTTELNSKPKTPTELTNPNAIEESSIIDALKGYKNTVQEYISNEKKDFVEKLTDLFDKEDDQDKGKSVSQTQTEKSDRVEDLKEKSTSAVKTTELIVQETKSNLIRDKPDLRNGDEKAKLTTDRIKAQQLVGTAIRNTGDLEAELKRQPIMNEFGNGPLIKDADTPRIAVSENEQDLGININTKFLEAEHLNVYTLPQASLESKSVTVPIDITTNDDSIAGTSSSRKPTEPTSTNASEEASIMDTLKSYKNTVQEYISNEKKDFVEKLTDLFDKEDDQDKGKSISETQAEKSDRVEDLKEKSTSAVKTTELTIKTIAPKQSSVSGVANMANNSTSGVTELTIKPIAPKQSSVYGVANMVNDSTLGVIVQETKSNLIRDKPDLENEDGSAKLTADRIKTQQLVETAIRNTGDLEAELKRQPITNEFGNGPLIKDADTPRIAVSENEQDLGININTKFLEAEHLNVYTLPQTSLESKSVTVPIDITTNYDSIAGTSSSRKPTEPTSPNAIEESSIINALKGYKKSAQDYISNEKKDFVEKLTDLFDKEDDQDKGKSISETQAEKSDSLEDLKEKPTSAVNTTQLSSKLIAAKQLPATGDKSGLDPHKSQSKNIQTADEASLEATLGKNESNSELLPIETPVNDLGINFNTEFLQAERLNVDIMSRDYLKNSGEEAKFADHSITEYVRVPTEVASDDESNDETLANLSSIGKDLNFFEQTINYLKSATVKLSSIEDIFADDERKQLPKQHSVITVESEIPPKHRADLIKAAVIIQSAVRGYRTRKALNKTGVSKKKIVTAKAPAEAVIKREQRSSAAKAQKANADLIQAAIIIQSAIRGYRIRKALNKTGVSKKKIVTAKVPVEPVIKRDQRSSAAKAQKANADLIQAAIIIQSAIRGYRIRKALNKTGVSKKKIVTAKVPVQPVIEREQRSSAAKAQKANADLIQAAIIIQSAIRGYRIRKALNKTGVSKKKIVTAKAPAEAVIKREQRSSVAKAQKANADLIQAAIIIQSAIRGHRIRKALNKTGVSKKKIVTTKAPAEAVIKREQRSSVAKAQKANADLIQAAIIIQSAIRGYRIRKALNKTGVSKKKIVTAKVPVEPVIKREQRSSVAKPQKANADLIQAAIIIQSAIRGYRVRKALLESGLSKRKLVTSEAPGKAVVERAERPVVTKKSQITLKSHDALSQAAVIIQSAIRGYRARKDLHKRIKQSGLENKLTDLKNIERSREGPISTAAPTVEVDESMADPMKSIIKLESFEKNQIPVAIIHPTQYLPQPVVVIHLAEDPSKESEEHDHKAQPPTMEVKDVKTEKDGQNMVIDHSIKPRITREKPLERKQKLLKDIAFEETHDNQILHKGPVESKVEPATKVILNETQQSMTNITRKNPVEKKPKTHKSASMDETKALTVSEKLNETKGRTVGSDSSDKTPKLLPKPVASKVKTMMRTTEQKGEDKIKPKTLKTKIPSTSDVGKRHQLAKSKRTEFKRNGRSMSVNEQTYNSKPFDLEAIKKELLSKRIKTPPQSGRKVKAHARNSKKLTNKTISDQKKDKLDTSNESQRPTKDISDALKNDNTSDGTIASQKLTDSPKSDRNKNNGGKEGTTKVSGIFDNLKRDVENLKKSVHEKSATTIQKTFRGYQTRKDLKAHISDQKVSKEASKEEKEYAARIDKPFTLEESKSHADSPSDNQGTLDIFDVEEFQNLALENSATTIQKTFRGYKARKDLLNKRPSLRKAEESHNILDNATETHKTTYKKDISEKSKDKKTVDSSKEKKFQNASSEKPATTIQKTFRGYKTRKDLLSKGLTLKKRINKPLKEAEESSSKAPHQKDLSAEIKDEQNTDKKDGTFTIFNSSDAKKFQNAALEKPATTIQKTYRGYKIRKDLLNQGVSLKKVENKPREKAEEIDKQLNNAAKSIQRSYKGYRTRKTLNRNNDDSLKSHISNEGEAKGEEIEQKTDPRTEKFSTESRQPPFEDKNESLHSEFFESKTVIQPEFVDNQKTQKKKLIEKPSLVKNAIKAASAGTLLETAASTIQKAYRNHLNKNGSTSAKAPIKSYSDSAQGENNFKETIENSDESSTFIGPDTSFDLSDVESVETRSEQTSNIERPNTSDTPTPDDRKYDEMDLEISTSPTLPLSIHPEGHDNEITNSLSVPQGIRRKRSIMDPTAPSFEDIINANEVSSSDFKPQWYVGDDLIIPTNGTEPSSICSSSPSSSVNPLASSSNFKVLSSVDARKENLNSTLQLTPSINSAVVSTSSLLLPSDTEIVHDKNSLKQLNKHSRAVSANKEEHFDEENKSKEIDSIDVKTGVQKLDDYISQEKTTSLDGLPDTEETLNLTSTDAFSVRVEAIEDTKGNEAETSQEITTELCKSCADGIHETDIATIQSRRKSIEPELGKESVREVANGEDTKDDFNSSEKHFDEIKQFVLMEELNPNVNDSINKETEIVNETNGYKNKDDMELSAMDSTNKEQSIDTDDYQLSKSNVITAIGQDKQDIPQSSNNNINGYPSITFIPPSPEDDSSSRESTHASIATESEQMNTNDEEDIPTRIVESIDTSPKGENVENGNEEGEQIKSEKTTDERDNQNKFNDKTHSVDICQEGVTITSGDENNECKQIVGEHQNGDKSNETIATAETNDTRTSSQDGANLRPIVKEELIEKTELVIDATERKKDDSSEIINDVDQQIPTSEGIDLSKPKLVEKNNEEIINAPEFVESAEAALIKNAEQDQKFEDDFNAAIGLGVDEKSVTEDLINKIEQNSVEKSTLRSQSKDEESQIDEKNVQDFISNSDSKDAGLRNVKSKFLSDDDSKEEKEGTQLTSTKSSEDKVDNSSKRISDGSNLSDKTDERRQSEDKATISEATKITINNEAPSVLNASSADVENKSINDKIENKKQENSENRNKQTPSEDGDSESEVETEATRKKRTPSEEQKSLLGTSESLSTEKNNRNNSKDELDSSEQKSGEIMTELKHVNAELESKRSKEDDSLNDMSEIISNGVNKKISEETDEGISKDALPKSLEKEDTLNTKQKEVHSENTKEDEMTKIAKVAPNIIKDKNEVIQPLKVVMPSQEDIEIAAKLLDSSFPVSKEVDSKPEFNYLEETHKAHSKDTPSSSLEEEVPPKAEKKVVYSEITKDDVMDNKPEIAPNIIKDKSKDLQSSKIVMPSQEDIEIAAKLLESSFSHHHLFKFKIENQINAHASEEQKATSKDDNVESKLSHKENQLTTSTDGIYSKNEQAPSNLDEEIQAKLDKLIEENLPLTEADVNTIESNDLPRENAPEEVIEKPCIKKSIPRSPLSTASDPEESELETTTTKADSTTTTPGYDDASDNDVLERPPSMPDTLDAMTAKINETERMVARMHQRRASEHQVSIDSVEQPLAFDESTWEPIKPMQEIQKSSSIEVEDDIILQKLQRGNTTRESSAQSESVIFGDSTESDDIFNHKLEPKTLYRMSTIATDRSTYRPPNLLLKSVTIDDAVKYIDPEKSTEESGSSFCMDDDTSADVRKKMMAYSVSEADSDYYDAGEQTTRIHDDFNISTALENFPSTDTDTTIISAAATKIQAGARGFLTRQRLRRASMGTKSSLTEETKTSFGNDAIGESLDQLVEEEVGKRMPKVQYHRQVGVNSLPSAFGNSNETEIIHSSPTDEDIRTVDDSDGLKLAELTSAAALLPLSTTKNMPHREWSSIDGQREVHRLSTSSENDVNGEIEAEDESAQMPSNLEATLAARRLTLQRGDAMRNDSTPDDDNGNGKQVDATKNMPTTTTTFTQNKSVVESTTTTTTTTKTEKKNYSDTTATTIKMDKIKWFAMRQNSMPVQIDSEVFRVLPKHMRKRIKSAEGEPKKRIRLPRD